MNLISVKNLNIRLLSGCIQTCLVMIIMMFLNSCNQNFEPFKENDQYLFSMYGFLDANADTQWVRTVPVRNEFELSSDVPEMAIHIHNLNNGTRIEMSQAIKELRGGINVLNSWTVEKLYPEVPYRIIAEMPDGRKSEATVTLPDAFPTPRIFVERVPGLEPKHFIWIDGGVERLADVQSRWYVRLSTPFWEAERKFVFSLKTEAEPGLSNSFSVPIFPDDELDEIVRQSIVLLDPDARIEILHHQIFVASAGPEWDEAITDIPDLIYNLPDGFSNVENGLGYVAGIFSRLIPFKECFDGGQLVACDEEAPFW